MSKNTDWGTFQYREGEPHIGYWRWCDGRVIVLTHDPDCPIYDIADEDWEPDASDPYDRAIVNGDIWVAREYIVTAFEVTPQHLGFSMETKPERFEHLRAGLVGLEEAKELAPTFL